MFTYFIEERTLNYTPRPGPNIWAAGVLDGMFDRRTYTDPQVLDFPPPPDLAALQGPSVCPRKATSAGC